MVTPAVQNGVLPRAGATLDAHYVGGLAGFVQDEHEDYWSICAGFHESIVPVQRHTSDGWVAAIFHRGGGYIKIVAPGEMVSLSKGQTVIAQPHRQGVRWEFANPQHD